MQLVGVERITAINRNTQYMEALRFIGPVLAQNNRCSSNDQ